MREIKVFAVDSSFLELLVDENENILLKIDVEGFEPQLLKGLEKFISRYKPDLIVEILEETESDIRRWLSGKPFKTSVFTNHGLVENPLKAINDQRDWYFEHV